MSVLKMIVIEEEPNRYRAHFAKRRASMDLWNDWFAAIGYLIYKQPHRFLEGCQDLVIYTYYLNGRIERAADGQAWYVEEETE